MPVPEVVIVGAARTPIGRYGGALRDVHPAELGAVPARAVGARAGIPDTVPAQTVNKACASGMQTIATGAQSIQLGEAEAVLAGGIESMSRMPYLVDASDA